MKKYKNLAGYRFGRLTVKELAGKAKSGKVCWRCSCDCGNVVIVRGCDLLSGHTKSCGCFKAEIRKIVHTKHGARKNNTAERLYLVWKNIKKRCENKNAPAYPDYGGRGITLCDEWHDYANFRKWALSHGYKPNAPQWECTIDRINNDGNYEPSNCRWVSMAVQSRNKRNTRKRMPA